MPSRFDRWKAWSQLVLRVNQYDGELDSNKKNFAIWSKMVRLDPTIMLLLRPNGTDLDRGVEKVPPASAQ